MATFEVSKTHIEALLTATLAWELLSLPDELDRIGQEMRVLNRRSALPGQPAEPGTDDPLPDFEFLPLLGVPDPPTVFKLARSFNEQARDAAGYGDTSTAALMARLSAEAVARWAKTEIPGTDAGVFALLASGEYRRATSPLADDDRDVFLPSPGGNAGRRTAW